MARDEGRSCNYEAEERNDADAAFCRNPEGRVLVRAACFVARLVKGGQPFTAPRFAHPIPESSRRNRAGLNQRFPHYTFQNRVTLAIMRLLLILD
jgi:hypothetical protein